MKYFSIIILSLLIGQSFFATPAFARTANPNLLPKVQPLLAPTEGVAPNYQGNLNSELQPAPTSGSGKEQAAGGELKNSNLVEGSEESKSSASGESAGGMASFFTGSKPGVFGVAFIIGLALVLAYVFWKRGFFKKIQE